MPEIGETACRDATVGFRTEDGMITSSGDMFGIAVPGTWEWPLEFTNLKDASPYYSDYLAYQNDQVKTLRPEANYWGKYPVSSALVINAPCGD
jgi:hypothetical protein